MGLGVNQADLAVADVDQISVEFLDVVHELGPYLDLGFPLTWAVYCVPGVHDLLVLQRFLGKVHRPKQDGISGGCQHHQLDSDVGEVRLFIGKE